MRNLALGLIGVTVLVVVVALRRDAVQGSEESGVPSIEAPSSPGRLMRRGGQSSQPAERPAEAGAGALLDRGQERSALELPDEREPERPGSEAEAEPLLPPAIELSQPPAAYALEREIDVAGELFHASPARFHAWVGEADRGIDEDRRMLALAFASAVAGVDQDWGPVRAHLEESPRVSKGEVELFDLAVARRRYRAGGPAPERPIGMAMDMVLRHRTAKALLEAREFEGAAVELSRLLQDELEAPWVARREMLVELSGELRQAQEHHRWNRRGNWPHAEIVVQPGDSLIAIRKRFLADPRYDHLSICTGLIDRVNGIGDRQIQAGQVLRIPTEPVNVVVDLSAHWVLYRFGTEVALAWEAGIGAPDSPTRPGEYVIGEKIPEPPWWRPGEAPIPYGDPRNELGSRWLAWNDDLGPTSLGFHGTNAPETIGQEVSQGCVRLRNEDVEEMYEILPRGARVTVRP